jgi:hypothetical protein
MLDSQRRQAEREAIYGKPDRKTPTKNITGNYFGDAAFKLLGGETLMKAFDGDHRAQGQIIMGGLVSLHPGMRIKNTSVVKNTAKTFKLFRAVGEKEFKDIATNKVIRPGGGSMESKLFAETFDALKQGIATEKNFRVIEVEVSESMYNKLFKTDNLDPHITQGRNTFAVDIDQVDEFNKNVIKIDATEEIKNGGN